MKTEIISSDENMNSRLTIINAGMDDYPMVQNMARFYVYDMSKSCGHTSDDWSLPKDGLFECFDFKNYFCDADRKTYLIKIYDEVAGFALLNQAVTDPLSNWNMGEFFILGKFQGQGLGKIAAQLIWQENPGNWEVSVLPENKPALHFWESTIGDYTKGSFEKIVKDVDYDTHQPKRVIFSFRVK